jgi:predicted DNA-binding protein with PD1-like motif
VRFATALLLAALFFGCASAHPTSGHPDRVYAVRLHPGDDGNGKTIGGHLSEGSLVYTTAEIVVADIAGVAFTREVDPATKFKELVVRESQ